MVNEVSNKKVKSKRKIRDEDFWGYVFILVPLAVFLAFTIYPLISAVIISFQEFKPLGTKWVGLANYKATFNDPSFYQATLNTVIYTIITVPLSIGISFLIAILILPLQKKFQNAFKAVYYLPAIASGVALSFVWKWIYDPLPNGLLNGLVKFFGVANHNWLGSNKTAMGSLIFMALLSGQGTRVIIYIASLLGVDSSYYEAADIDGATFFQKLWYIVIPLVKPTTIFLLITGVIGSFQVFQNAFLMTGGGPDGATTMVGLMIFNNAFTYFHYGQAASQALVLTVIIALLAFIQFKVVGSDVEY